MFPLFLKRTAEVLAPRLAVVFRRLLRLGSFPVCWRVANVTPISKSPPSSPASNYRPIFLTPILYIYCPKFLSVWCRFVLGVLWNTEACFQSRSSLIGKVLALVMPSCVAQTLQSALEMGLEAIITHIDFSATFDRVNHQGINSLQALFCGC